MFIKLAKRISASCGYSGYEDELMIEFFDWIIDLLVFNIGQTIILLIILSVFNILPYGVLVMIGFILGRILLDNIKHSDSGIKCIIKTTTIVVLSSKVCGLIGFEYGIFIGFLIVILNKKK